MQNKNNINTVYREVKLKCHNYCGATLLLVQTKQESYISRIVSSTGINTNFRAI